MTQRWLDYIEDLFDSGRIDRRTRARVENGEVEVCPICLELNAMSPRHTDEASNVLLADRLETGLWSCSHCGATNSTDADFLLN